jgi:hypothetical protein
MSLHLVLKKNFLSIIIYSIIVFVCFDIMEKDKRYKTIKHLIDGGHITLFNEIFDHIPKSKVAQDLGTNYNRLQRLISHVDEFKFKEIFTIGDFFEVEPQTMVSLVLNQYISTRKAKKRTI